MMVILSIIYGYIFLSYGSKYNEKYEKISSKVPEYYEKTIDVVKIDGHGTKEEVYQRIKDVIQESINQVR